jgi:putative ABC transport system permease protein
LKLVIAIPLVGMLLGTAVGAWMGRGLTELYTRFYRFPVFGFDLELSVVFLALMASVTASVLGSWAAVRRAVILPPAEAMRPEPPADYRPTFVERLGLGTLLPHTLRMILRQLERHPMKAFLSCVGIAMGVAVLILGSFSLDAINYIMDFQFRLAQTQDMTLTFVEPTSSRVLSEVRHLPGVLKASPFRSTPTRLRHGHHHRRVGLMGLVSGNDLFRLIDDQERLVPLPPDGVMLSSKLAQLLDVRVGDVITVEVMEGERPVRQVRVTAIFTEFSGTNAYMDIRALHRLLREGRSYSGVFLAVDNYSLGTLYQTLKNTPRVAGVNLKNAALKSFEDTVAENLLRMRSFNIGFASIIAFGVVYNSARISLAERSRELATLRVIGFTRAEISAILLGELAVLTSFAIPIGFAMGYGFAWLATLGLDTELYRIPLIVTRSTYGFSAVVIIIAAFFSGLVVRRRLDHLDLVAVLKSKE